MRLRKAGSKHEGQVDVSVTDTDDAHEPEVILRADAVGVVLSEREAATLAAALTTRRTEGPR